jgi:hypothetical protein
MTGFPGGQNLAAGIANASNSQEQAPTLQRPWAAPDVEPSVTLQAQSSVRTMAILKPFLMLASVAFVTGFAGYLAVLSLAAPITPDEYQHAQIPAASTPDDWNIGKRI